MKTFILLIAGLLYSLCVFGNHPRPIFADWCDDLTWQLEQAQSDATRAYSHGDYPAAMKVFKDTLGPLALDEMAHSNQSLSRKALSRGLEMTDALEMGMAHHTNRARQMSFFLSKYFDFIIRVTKRLDRPYYSYRHHYRRRRGLEHIEQLYVEMALKQLNLVLNHFVILKGGIAYPVGHPDLFLNLVSLTSAYVAQDLEDSLLGTSYACATTRLSRLHATLADYLQTGGTGASWDGPRSMVQKAYWQARGAIGKGQRPCPSYGSNDNWWPSSDHDQTKDILRGTLRLGSGQTKTVRLPYSQYIRKLIISAEGIRWDATFDVVVNGDIKGTIYVPGRDPSYFVTVEDYAQSIELVSRNGSARILNILLIP